MSGGGTDGKKSNSSFSFLPSCVRRRTSGDILVPFVGVGSWCSKPITLDRCSAAGSSFVVTLTTRPRLSSRSTLLGGELEELGSATRIVKAEAANIPTVKVCRTIAINFSHVVRFSSVAMLHFHLSVG